MKCVQFNSVQRLFILTVFVTLTGLTAAAQTAQVRQELHSTHATVRYMGSREETMSVAVQFDNTKGQRFTVTVRDQDGYQLFEGSFREKKFDKIFELPGKGISRLSFSIGVAGAARAQSFEIDTKKAEEMMVKRVG
ncbi:MAG: hypothetical protein JST39_01750 [Bacteroidetes bacterium]|nr:hypothetical protein [Bacteroidota bacterium]